MIFKTRVLMFSFCIAATLTPVSFSYADNQATIPASTIPTNNLTFDQLQQAAQAGDPDAQYAIGYMYYYGKGVGQDSAKGANWIKRASVQGQEQAIKALAMMQGSTATTAIDAVQPKSTMTAAPTLSTQPRTTAVPVNLTLASSNPQFRQAPASAYTIQLLGSSKKDDLTQYIQANALTGNAMFYPTKHNGQNWYVLVYGVYKSRSEAQAALLKLPAAIRAENPWIKSMGQVKAQIKV